MIVNQARAVKILVALLAVLIILTVSISASQTPTALNVNGEATVSVSSANLVWEKTYGGTDDDRALYALPVGDARLVIGSSKSLVANATVGWALMLDADGNAMWNQTFLEGDDGTELRSAVGLEDGFLLVGNVFSATGDINGYVARIDRQGNLQWKILLGAEKTDKLFSGIATADGFVVFGLTSSSVNGQSSAWAVKLNVDGNPVWDRTYDQVVDSALRGGVLCEDGDFIAAGYTDVLGEDNYDFYILKLNGDGDMIWNKTYGDLESEKAYAISKAVDGFVLVGEKQSPDATTDTWVLKVDLAGNTLWDKTVGGKAADSPTYITPSKTGGYFVAGYTFSFGNGERDFWLFKITDQGQVEFSCTYGNEAFQEAYCVIESGDGSLVMVGWTDPFDEPTLVGKAVYDFYVVKLNVAQDDKFSNYPFIIYAVVAFAALAAALLLLVRLHTKNGKNS